MKTIRLHIKPDGRMLLSVPYFTSDRYIKEFLDSKHLWIERTQKRLAKFATNPGILIQDSAAKLAGFKFPFPADGESSSSYEKRWRQAAMDNYRKTVARLYPIVKKHTDLVPEIRLRKMKSLWGSCNRKTGTITLNTLLFRAPQRCIDYVVLHELTHYLYKNHDAVFYNFIAQHMNDWKERQKYLNQTVSLS